jgi:hypothetical protein
MELKFPLLNSPGIRQKQVCGVTAAVVQTGRKAPRRKQRSWDENVVFFLRLIITSSD